VIHKMVCLMLKLYCYSPMMMWSSQSKCRTALNSPSKPLLSHHSQSQGWCYYRFSCLSATRQFYGSQKKFPFLLFCFLTISHGMQVTNMYLCWIIINVHTLWAGHNHSCSSQSQHDCDSCCFLHDSLTI
jgi:hypothetical protein